MLLSTIIVRAAIALLVAQVVKEFLHPSSRLSAPPEPRALGRSAAERIESARLAAQKVEAERLAAASLEAEKAEAEKVAAEQAAAEKAAADRLVADKAEAERLAAETLAAEVLAAETLAAEKSAAEEAERLRSSVACFDGHSNYIELPISLADISDQVTIEFWAKGGDSLPQASSIFGAHDAQKNRVFNIHLPWSNGSLYWDSGNSGASYDRIKKQAETEDYKEGWVHWAFMKNASTGSMRIYKNGEIWHQGRQKRRALNAASICSVTIGAFGDGNGNYKWCGALAELRIWNRALKPKEIQRGMKARACDLTLENGLVAYWPLNQALTEASCASVNNVSYVTEADIPLA
ncbi:MAG: hypothetical protein COA42_22705 [Alteromonadaceae bacterium]|nr:MAG: hypothetical protein COA42_22705 [Alteromonadaceae bacterium]